MILVGGLRTWADASLELCPPNDRGHFSEQGHDLVFFVHYSQDGRNPRAP